MLVYIMHAIGAGLIWFSSPPVHVHVHVICMCCTCVYLYCIYMTDYVYYITMCFNIIFTNIIIENLKIFLQNGLI